MSEEFIQEVAPKLPSRLTFDGPKGALFKAMAEARKHFQPLSTDATADVKNKEGKQLYKFKYAPLDGVIAALEPGLNAAGICLSQPFDGDVLYTIVACGDSSMTVETPLPSWSTPQDLGSLLTYLRRYQIKGIFGVADSEDDDGNAASGTVATITRKEPTVAPKDAGISDAKQTVVKKAKELDISSADFAVMVKDHTNKSWKDCGDNDAQKLLVVLEAKSVFGKDGAK